MKKIFIFTFSILFCFNSYAKRVERFDSVSKVEPEVSRFVEYSGEIESIENYLSNLKNFTADFVQISNTGNIAEGKFYLSRPNNLRVDYNPPEQIQIIANEKKLYYYDKELDEVTKVGMKRTPVSFLLSEEFSFDGKKIDVVDFQKGKRTMQISLKNRKKDELGIMTMVFDSNPLVLRKIRLMDEFEQMTDVSFYDIDVKSVIGAEMFKVGK